MAEQSSSTSKSASSSETSERRSSRKDKRRSTGVRVVERNQAVYLVMRRLIGLALLATLAAGISVVCMLGIYSKPVAPVYVPATDDGHLLPLVPLNQPNVGRGDVGMFALEAIHAANTYDYINYRDELNEATPYFTSMGWKQYSDQLEASRTLVAVQERKMIVSVEPTGEVTIPGEGVREGVYMWRVEVPIEIKYTAHGTLANGSVDPGNTQKGTVILFIRRVPTTVNPRGLAIGVYQFKPASGA